MRRNDPKWVLSQEKQWRFYFCLYSWARLVCSYPFLLMSLSDSSSGFGIRVMLASWNVLGSVSYLISWSSLYRISIISSLKNW